MNASKLSFVVALLPLLGSCLKEESFPVEPAITMKTFVQSGDTILLAVDFTDGDGDIGLGQGDTLAPYNVDGDYYYNFRCLFEKKQEGVWSDVQAYYNYRIKVITPSGQNKALNGEIAVEIGPPFPGPRPFPYPPINPGDTLRVNVRLIDRALHTSNTVTSEAIVLQ